MAPRGAPFKLLNKAQKELNYHHTFICIIYLFYFDKFYD